MQEGKVKIAIIVIVVCRQYCCFLILLDTPERDSVIIESIIILMVVDINKYTLKHSIYYYHYKRYIDVRSSSGKRGKAREMWGVCCVVRAMLQRRETRGQGSYCQNIHTHSLYVHRQPHHHLHYHY